MDESGCTFGRISYGRMRRCLVPYRLTAESAGWLVETVTGAVLRRRRNGAYGYDADPYQGLQLATVSAYMSQAYLEVPPRLYLPQTCLFTFYIISNFNQTIIYSKKISNLRFLVHTNSTQLHLVSKRQQHLFVYFISEVASFLPLLDVPDPSTSLRNLRRTKQPIR
ncbi:hypothetical protein M422DRAFT_254248 [Sphaerobolus stellatus SS14]|uniref:Uncharacterized protein n=1 Tax=Sphaerobolus stellatus (strain SS14) TaxID=990650 RepID=A0A0C9UHF4_SPHS4|nr:hypothetical protein M422DRAFT_254248 [Sphaerobolus stellatus SS14]